MKWLMGMWYRRLRGIDMDVLWPECCRHAQSLDHAKAAFASHAFHDKAWMVLGHDEVYRLIDALEPV
jgi:hypothetical protein